MSDYSDSADHHDNPEHPLYLPSAAERADLARRQNLRLGRVVFLGSSETWWSDGGMASSTDDEAAIISQAPTVHQWTMDTEGLVFIICSASSTECKFQPSKT